MRDHFLGEQFHRTSAGGMVNQPTLIEVADKFLHWEFLSQGLDPFHAVLRVVEDPHAPINTFKCDLLQYMFPW